MDNEPDVESALERFGATALRIKAERDELVTALRRAVGNMLNVKIALDVGDTKAKASASLATAIKSAEDALTRATT